MPCSMCEWERILQQHHRSQRTAVTKNEFVFPRLFLFTHFGVFFLLSLFFFFVFFAPQGKKRLPTRNSFFKLKTFSLSIFSSGCPGTFLNPASAVEGKEVDQKPPKRSKQVDFAEMSR